MRAFVLGVHVALHVEVEGGAGQALGRGRDDARDCILRQASVLTRYRAQRQRDPCERDGLACVWAASGPPGAWAAVFAV